MKIVIKAENRAYPDNIGDYLWESIKPAAAQLGVEVLRLPTDEIYNNPNRITTAERKIDFRKGKRLGKHDRIFTWEKPKRRPKGIAQHLYDALPPSLEVRVICFTVDHRGYRSKTIMVATTLLDSIPYPKNEIADLYERRWEAEIDLRHLKTSMDMDMLRTKSPEMARKEIAIYFLAYNLIRSLMDCV